jgi:hypothetical protein
MDVREMYPDLGEEPFYGPGDYGSLLASLGPIAVRTDQNDYQGYSWVLYDFGGDSVGFLRFGWGSCSGCDALQACSTYREIEELRDSLESSIRRESRDGMIAYLRTIDPSVSWNAEDEGRFVAEALAYLGAAETP